MLQRQRLGRRPRQPQIHRRIYIHVRRRLLQLASQTQPTVCLSTQQAEYYALSEGTKEALILSFLLRDLGFGQSLPTMLFCDNKGAIAIALHPANKPASHHFDMRIHFCRQFELGDVSTTFTTTPDMVADFMTKQTQRLTHERH
jgi:hypothetical protein